MLQLTHYDSKQAQVISVSEYPNELPSGAPDVVQKTKRNFGVFEHVQIMA